MSTGAFLRGALALALALTAFALWVRLAPADPARWHVDPETAPDPGPGGHRATFSLDLPPARALERLMRIALGTARTRLIAGSPAEGRLTFETRSALWGFPDYTTVSARPAVGGGTRLTLLGRLRFGRSDLGVNRARIARWIAALEAGGEG